MNQNQLFSAVESFNGNLDRSNCRLSEVVKAPRMNSAGQVKPVPLRRRRPLAIIQHKESEQQREVLYDFPSFPDLTLEQRRDLSQTACLIFHAADEVSVTAVDFLRHFDKFHDINVLTGKYVIKMYLGPYKTTIEEFVKLPEIECALYPLRLTDKITKTVYNRYRSFINVVKTYPIFAFRFCVIQCFKEVTEDATRIFGAITIQTLCDIFNNQPGIQNFFQEKIYDGQVIKRFGKLSLMEALCCFCSRDIVIRIISNDLTIIRLRNHPDFLIQKIENERVLAEKAADFYKAYVKKNSSRLDWPNLRIDPLDIYYNPDLIFISSYPSLFLDNVYAALHYKKSVQDYPALYRAISLYINKPPDMCTFRSLTENPDINLLIEMVSPEAFEAIEKWDEEKQKLYIKIANELASKLNELDRDFVVDFIDVFPVKSRLLASFMIWSLKRMARHILLVTEQPDFIDRDEIVKKIQIQFKYNIHEWLGMFGISFEDIFFNPEVYYLLAAILIKRQNGIKLYRNMASIMRDKSLIIGFPYSTVKRLLNCLHQGVLMDIGENGYCSEIQLVNLYKYCYKKSMDAYEKRKLFGSNYHTVKEFLDSFGIDEIDSTALPDGQWGYKCQPGFHEAYGKAIDEKRKGGEAVKRYYGVLQKMKKIPPDASRFTAWKMAALNYDLQVLRIKEVLLTKHIS